MILQIVKWSPYKDDAKKKLAGKMTLSDGVSEIWTMVPQKLFDNIEERG